MQKASVFSTYAPVKKAFFIVIQGEFQRSEAGADAFAVKRRNGFSYTAVQLIKFHMCELLSVIIRFCREATEKHRVRLNFARTCNSMFFLCPTAEALLLRPFSEVRLPESSDSARGTAHGYPASKIDRSSVVWQARRFPVLDDF